LLSESAFQSAEELGFALVFGWPSASQLAEKRRTRTGFGKGTTSEPAEKLVFCLCFEGARLQPRRKSRKINGGFSRRRAAELSK
jgi:hypothetical protein